MKQVDKCMDRIETDLILQGCTAIEDKLQENVAWTIDYFIKSGKKTPNFFNHEQ